MNAMGDRERDKYGTVTPPASEKDHLLSVFANALFYRFDTTYTPLDRPTLPNVDAMLRARWLVAATDLLRVIEAEQPKLVDPNPIRSGWDRIAAADTGEPSERDITMLLEYFHNHYGSREAQPGSLTDCICKLVRLYRLERAKREGVEQNCNEVRARLAALTGANETDDLFMLVTRMEETVRDLNFQLDARTGDDEGPLGDQVPLGETCNHKTLDRIKRLEEAVTELQNYVGVKQAHG